MLVSCRAHDPARAAYERAWATFVAGDLAGAAKQASGGATRFQTQRQSEWYWDLRLLSAEVLTIQSNRKEAAAILKEPVPALPQLGQAEVRRLLDLVDNGMQSRERTAELIGQATAAAKDPDLLIRAMLQKGALLYDERKPAEALAAAQAALKVAEQNGNLYRASLALNNLCYYERGLHQYEESIAYGLRALETAQRVGAHRIAAAAHGNLGSTYTWLGDYDASAKHQQQAVGIFHQIGATFNLMIALGELGRLYDTEDDLPKAMEYYRRAFDLSRELGNNSNGARHAANIALTCIKSENWPAAKEWNERAAELAENSQNSRVELLVERNRARIAWANGRAAQAASISRGLIAEHAREPFLRWESYYLLGVIDAAAKRFPEANRSFENALRAIGEERSELSDPQNRITQLSQYIEFYQKYVDTLVRENDNAGALRILESSRARVLSERMGREVRERQFPSAGSFKQAAASTHSAILSFWVAPARSFAWLITGSGLERFQLPGSAEIAALVTKYRETVEHSLRDPIASNDPAGLALWHALMEEIAPHIAKGTSLVVIPDGPLHRLNLETLINPSPKPHYWIEDVQIAVSPSITIAASTPVSAAPSAHALLVIGDPMYAGTSYEPLPNAATEMREVQSHFTGWSEKAYERANASPAAYTQSNPAGYSLIHFAAHAEANYERPLESSIILSQAGGHNKLLARDVTDIPIHASLVTISACRSAGTRAYAGEGLMGFAWAFLNAGARAVIAGLWDVSDSSTGQLMDRLYAGIAAGQEPAAALRNAKLSMLNGSPNFRKPFYWAPFQVYLGSAAR